MFFLIDVDLIDVSFIIIDPWKSKSKTKQRMAFRMIHLKDSLLPMCRVWSLDFLVDIHIYIYIYNSTTMQNDIICISTFDFNQSTRRLGENLLFYIIFLWVQKHYLHPPSPHHVAKDVPKCHRQVFTALVLSWNNPGSSTKFTKDKVPHGNLHKQKKHTLQIQSPENGNDGTYSKYYAFYFGDWDTPIILWSIWRLMPRDTHAHTHTQKKND